MHTHIHRHTHIAVCTLLKLPCKTHTYHGWHGCNNQVHEKTNICTVTVERFQTLKVGNNYLLVLFCIKNISENIFTTYERAEAIFQKVREWEGANRGWAPQGLGSHSVNYVWNKGGQFNMNTPDNNCQLRRCYFYLFKGCLNQKKKWPSLANKNDFMWLEPV